HGGPARHRRRDRVAQGVAADARGLRTCRGIPRPAARGGRGRHGVAAPRLRADQGRPTAARLRGRAAGDGGHARHGGVGRRAGALELVSAAPDLPAAPVPDPVAYDTDLDEARAVAAAVAAEVAAGTRPEKIAVLYRVNSQVAQLEAALADAGLSTRLIGATR